MNINKKISLFFSVLIIFSTFTACDENKNEQPEIDLNKFYTKNDFTEEQLDCSEYDVEKYTVPFWEGNIVYNECVFPIYSPNATIEPFSLMYNATEIVSVKSFDLKKTYVEGKDYILQDGKLVVIPQGDINVSGYTFIHREGIPEEMPDYLFVNSKRDGTEFFSNDTDILRRSIVVTYIHNDSWNYNIESNSKALKNTIKRLKKKKATTIVVTGDSISLGRGSSKDSEIAPYADGYVDMVGKALKSKYNNDKINIINSSVGGSTSAFTEEQLYEDVIAHKPSLVIIAYGMNDGMFDDKYPDYADNINKRIAYIRKKLPKCEILLVTSFIPNRNIFSEERYKESAESLYKIADNWKNVSVCDPQAIQSYLMNEKDKDFLCFMMDNMAHPNDYGLRIIAQSVLDVLE